MEKKFEGEGERAVFGDVRDGEKWKSVERISKGWSSDGKYRVATGDGRNLLLRVSGIEDDAAAIEYVRNNIDCIWKEGPAYLHGDFHPGNLIFMPDGEIGVIDFNRWEVGDPYEEFDALESFGIEHSIPYCIGQIDAYFDSEIPDDFWMALAVYVAHTSLQFIKWAEKSGQEEIDKMKVRCRRAFENYDNFSRYIPKWYTSEYSRRFAL